MIRPFTERNTDLEKLRKISCDVYTRQKRAHDRNLEEKIRTLELEKNSNLRSYDAEMSRTVMRFKQVLSRTQSIANEINDNKTDAYRTAVGNGSGVGGTCWREDETKMIKNCDNYHGDSVGDVVEVANIELCECDNDNDTPIAEDRDNNNVNEDSNYVDGVRVNCVLKNEGVVMVKDPRKLFTGRRRSISADGERKNSIETRLALMKEGGAVVWGERPSSKTNDGFESVAPCIRKRSTETKGTAQEIAAELLRSRKPRSVSFHGVVKSIGMDDVTQSTAMGRQANVAGKNIASECVKKTVSAPPVDKKRERKISREKQSFCDYESLKEDVRLPMIDTAEDGGGECGGADDKFRVRTRRSRSFNGVPAGVGMSNEFRSQKGNSFSNSLSGRSGSRSQYVAKTLPDDNVPPLHRHNSGSHESLSGPQKFELPMIGGTAGNGIVKSNAMQRQRRNTLHSEFKPSYLASSTQSPRTRKLSGGQLLSQQQKAAPTSESETTEISSLAEQLMKLKGCRYLRGNSEEF